MSILWTILIGFLAGVVAKLVHPGKEIMGFIMTVLLGIGGSLLATCVGKAVGWDEPGEAAGFVGSAVGATVLLVVDGALKKDPSA